MKGASRAQMHLAAMWNAVREFARRVASGEERLWKVWWLAGIPVGWAASLLVVAAESLRYANDDYFIYGDALDVTRFLVYFAWLRLAWRCAGNVDFPLWTPLARVALSAGLVFMAIL